MKIGDTGYLVGEPSDPVRVEVIATRRTSVLAVPRSLGAVFHTTDTTGRAAASIARRWATFDSQKDRPASAHLIIGRDGTCYSLAPVTSGTWHVGKPGVVRGQKLANVNRGTYGIEIENAGKVRKCVDGKAYAYPYKISPPDLVETFEEIDGGLYESFPPLQVAAIGCVVRALSVRFPEWGREGFTLGHVDFDPDRKSDPWPLFTKRVGPRVLDSIFGGALNA